MGGAGCATRRGVVGQRVWVALLDARKLQGKRAACAGECRCTSWVQHRRTTPQLHGHLQLAILGTARRKRCCQPATLAFKPPLALPFPLPPPPPAPLPNPLPQPASTPDLPAPPPHTPGPPTACAQRPPPRPRPATPVPCLRAPEAPRDEYFEGNTTCTTMLSPLAPTCMRSKASSSSPASPPLPRPRMN